jgi:hypothetical protein
MEFRKAEHLSLAVELDCHLIEPSEGPPYTYRARGR